MKRTLIFTYLIHGSWKKLNSLYYEKYGYTFSLSRAYGCPCDVRSLFVVEVLNISLLEPSVADLFVQKSEGPFFVVIESILLAVSHTIKEFGILASGNVTILVQIGNSKDLLHRDFASCNVNLCSDQRKDTAVVRGINTIEVTPF